MRVGLRMMGAPRGGGGSMRSTGFPATRPASALSSARASRSARLSAVAPVVATSAARITSVRISAPVRHELADSATAGVYVRHQIDRGEDIARAQLIAGRPGDDRVAAAEAETATIGIGPIHLALRIFVQDRVADALGVGDAVLADARNRLAWRQAGQRLGQFGSILGFLLGAVAIVGGKCCRARDEQHDGQDEAKHERGTPYVYPTPYNSMISRGTHPLPRVFPQVAARNRPA